MRQIRPSNSATWMNCPGSPALVESLGLPTSGTNRFAAEGTAAHQLAERCLKQEADAKEFIGAEIEIEGDDATEAFVFTVDDDFARPVQEYLDKVRTLAYNGELIVEEPVSMENVLPGVLNDKGEPLQGTPDAVVLEPEFLDVVDLKFGRGVQVDAPGNTQLKIYALAVYDHYSVACEPERVSWHIAQPRLNHFDQEDETLEELEKFRIEVHEKVGIALTCEPGEELYPGEKQCQWCPASGRCKAQAKAVADTVFEDLDTLEVRDIEHFQNEELWSTLGMWRERVKFAEQWCKAVSAAVDDALARGITVPGWKLVEGRRGNRAWADDREAEDQLKKFRLKQAEMYSQKLISPAQAKKVLSDKRWKKLQEEGLIVQKEGKPQAAPISDPRSAINSESQFNDLDSESDDSDLL